MPAPRSARRLLNRRDWVYLFSLLFPFTVYALLLKNLLIFQVPQDPEMTEALGLMQINIATPKPPGFIEALGLLQSDLLFNLGYVALWSALFALARTRTMRWIVLSGFHALTIGIAVITTIAYQYYKATGSALDSTTLVLGLSAFAELRDLIASEVDGRVLALMSGMLLYALVGPLVVTSYIDGWYGKRTLMPRQVPSSWWHAVRVVGLVCMACVLLVLSLLPNVFAVGASRSFARAAFVQVLVSALAVDQSEEIAPITSDLPAMRLPTQAQLVSTAATQRRNVVVIALESTRAAATTPYNAALPTTPFLDELAQRSLLVEQAYAIIPHTHNALTAINCGVYPPLDANGTKWLAVPGSMPPICLPHLLAAQGYRTAFFMSHTKEFENSQQILQNQGYQDFTSIEDMDTAGFEPTNYFGFEDEIMLEPSRAWLENNRAAPFMAMYLTSAPHHDYLAPSKRHGRVEYTGNDLINRYLNSVRNQDFFLRQLFEQYRQLGLYENTIFVLLGDHGQGFGEHGRNGHDNAIYEEGLRIPLLIHDPQRFTRGARLDGPANQLDILPTVADLLGYQVEGGPYGGSSLVQPLPAQRTLMFSCSGDGGCMASLQGTAKYIDHFDDRPAEVFDLATDPGERTNIANTWPPGELERRRAEIVAWRAQVRAMYALPE